VTNPEESGSEDAPEGYVSFGYLEPLFGKRIMDRLSRQRVRFTARDASFLDIATVRETQLLICALSISALGASQSDRIVCAR
jgi:hypothetical protein